MKNGISVVVPAYNEAEGIGRFLTELVPELRTLDRPFEVLIVDDGSADATVRNVEEWSARDPAVRAIPLGRHRGIGAALAKGFAEASLPLVGYCDADGPFHMNLWGPAIGLLEGSGADLLCGDRVNRHAGEPVRRLYSVGFNLLAGSALGLSVRDINSPLKIVRKEMLARITLVSEGSMVDAELIDKVKRARGRIVEFSYFYRPRTAGYSKLGNLGNVVGTFFDLVRYCAKSRPSGR